MTPTPEHRRKAEEEISEEAREYFDHSPSVFHSRWQETEYFHQCAISDRAALLAVREDLAEKEAEIKRLSSRLYDREGLAEKAIYELERLGYRKCDIPACKCGGWHMGSDGLASKWLKRATDADITRKKLEEAVSWLKSYQSSYFLFNGNKEVMDFLSRLDGEKEKV